MNNHDPAQQPGKDATQNSAEQQWQEMREEKIKNDQDISLQSPQDANTEKHINFLEDEDTRTTVDDSSSENELSVAQRQWKEMREEKMNNDQDISLQSPQDANTEKHINFREQEE